LYISYLNMLKNKH